MPSPVGHALGGIAAGWLLEPPPPGPPAGPSVQRIPTLAFAALGVVADFDLLLGAHRGPTHSVGAVAVVAIVTWLVLRGKARRARWGLACAAAYGSHVVLDWLGSDTSPPFGVPALWPFASAYHQAPWPFFLAVSRRIHQPDLFWIPNALAIARELLILGPIVLLIAFGRSRGRRRLGSGVIASSVAVTIAGAAVERLSARQPGVDRGVEQSTQAQPATPRGDAPDLPSFKSYDEAVAGYLSGRFDEAVTALSKLPEADIKPDIKNDDRDLKPDRRFIQAAAMLHTEAAQAAFLNDGLAEFHLARAHQLVRDLRRIQAPGEFQRGWYLFASSVLQGSKSVSDAENLLAEARGLFPQDPELLTATGAALELQTFATGAVLARGFPNALRTIDPDTNQKRALESSARYLNEAATIAPDRDEAHLRLGRVLHRLGQMDRAAAELEIVRRRAADGAFKYLAALFEASVESTRRRPQRAAELYLEALATLPAQSAFVGLSHSYYELGRPEEAADALQNVFTLPTNHADPWFGYILGDAWHADSRLKAMRALVTQGGGTHQ